jgi:hypothetical protein
MSLSFASGFSRSRFASGTNSSSRSPFPISIPLPSGNCWSLPLR